MPGMAKDKRVKMRLGPGWTLKHKSGKELPATLRANIHISKGKVLAIFAVRKHKT
jgi:hypothetical protein